ncbi:MAG TPA: alginate export family protein, partial [Bacteroidales bacterium]|nr:alginate export family protein [Bacteroidales bacterium]
MNTKTFGLLIIFLCLMGFTLSVKGQNPFDISFSERARITAFDNAITFDDEDPGWTFARFRTSLSANYSPWNQLTLNANVVNENWIWIKPEDKDTRFAEIFIDKLNLHWKGTEKFPLELKAGRQNLIFDEGFICLDAQPLSGSRSIYFDAVKTKYSFNPKNTLTAFAAKARLYDEVLPVLNEGNTPQRLVEQPSKGYGVYYTHQRDEGSLSLYFFRKKTFATSDWPGQRKINTPGFRIQWPFENISLTAEAAMQFGEQEQSTHQAFGGYSYATYTMPQIQWVDDFNLGGFYYSGDNAETSAKEGWDPMWARWPKWSESYIYTHIREYNGKIAYWSNISAVYLTLNANSGKNIRHKISFYHLMANKNNLRDAAFDDGKTRGELFIYRLDYR